MKHHKSAGVSYEVLTVGDKQYKLRPLKVGVYAEMEAFILSQRGDPIAAASKAVQLLPAPQHQAVWDAAMRAVMNNRTVTAQEVADFENSVRGIAWKLWQCVKEDQPQIDSVEAAIVLLTEIGPQRAEEVQYKLKIATGEADLAKSDGPEVETTTGPGQDGQ